MTDTTVKLQVLPNGKHLELPSYQTSGAAGADIRSADALMVGNNETVMVSTGLAMEIPEGFEIQVRSRSGMASKGIFVTNSPGTIDSDYRGEVKILLTNLSGQPYFVNRNDRIAQLLLQPVYRATFTVVDGLSPTGRGSGGYGSTGV